MKDETWLGEFTKSIPRDWTDDDIASLKKHKAQGLSDEKIGKLMNRTAVAVQIKWRKLRKKDDAYNDAHRMRKYKFNVRFLNQMRPQSILDLYAGFQPFYTDWYSRESEKNHDVKLVTNDKNAAFRESGKLTYSMDALKLLCKFYLEGVSFDVIDLDPFGSAYECFDLAIKQANKGIAITYGEMGHVRWKRLDFVERFYGINALEDFKLDNLVKKTQEIGMQNKKLLEPILIMDLQGGRGANISRVYYKITKISLDPWASREAYKALSQTTKSVEKLDAFLNDNKEN